MYQNRAKQVPINLERRENVWLDDLQRGKRGKRDSMHSNLECFPLEKQNYSEGYKGFELVISIQIQFKIL